MNYLLGPGLGQRYARTDTTGTQSYLTDALGSVIALASSTGEVQTSYTYDPFGPATTSGAASANPYQFAGQPSDGTGPQYDLLRYYSASLGRFISQDPAGFLGSGINLYAYVGDDPVNSADPVGMAAVKDSYYSFINPEFISGVFNFAYGVTKVVAGTALLIGGFAADLTVVGAPIGIGSDLLGGYNLVTGIFRLNSAVNQISGAINQPTVCATNVQYAEQAGWNMAPFGGILQKFLGQGIS